MQSPDSTKIFSVLNFFKLNAEVGTWVRIRCLHGGIFFRPDLNYSVMSPLVLWMSHARTESALMPCLVLLVHMQKPWLLLWSITRAQPKSSQKQTGACISQPCNGNRLESKIFSMQCWLCEITTDKAQWFLTCDPFIAPAEPAPRFECLWAFYCEFQVCNPWLTDSAFIHYNLWEWDHLGFYWGGGCCFFIFKQFVSFQLFASCSGGRYWSDPLCLPWEAPCRVAQGAISCKKLR